MIGVVADDGRVKLDLFEAPLDLLLYLIRKNEIDVHDIPIADVTCQYQVMLEHARARGLLDLDFAGDYFLMAATLIHIKTRMLLPRRPTVDGAAPPEDPRADLVRRLLEYERFREAAMLLHERADLAATMVGRPPAALAELHDGEPMLDVDLLSLARAFRKVLEDKRLRTPHVYEPSRYTVRDRILHVVAFLEQRSGSCAFHELFDEGSVEEAVVTFLALLELVKRGFVRCRQQALLESIHLVLVAEDERPDRDALGMSEFDAPPPMDEAAVAPASDRGEVSESFPPGGFEPGTPPIPEVQA